VGLVNVRTVLPTGRRGPRHAANRMDSDAGYLQRTQRPPQLGAPMRENAAEVIRRRWRSTATVRLVLWRQKPPPPSRWRRRMSELRQGWARLRLSWEQATEAHVDILAVEGGAGSLELAHGQLRKRDASRTSRRSGTPANGEGIEQEFSAGGTGWMVSHGPRSSRRNESWDWREHDRTHAASVGDQADRGARSYDRQAPQLPHVYEQRLPGSGLAGR
jgi:hypothetical protein